MSDAFELDMDLLWRAGRIRDALEATPDGAGATDVVEAALHARERMHGARPAAALLDAVAAAWQGSLRDARDAPEALVEATLQAVTALEEALASGDSAAEDAIAAALAALGPVADADVPAAPTPPETADISLDGVNELAARLIQVDDDDRDELASLVLRVRDELAELAPAERGEIDAALASLDDGLEGKRWSARRRELVADGLAALGAGLEGLMLTLEDRQGLAPVDPGGEADLPAPAATVVGPPGGTNDAAAAASGDAVGERSGDEEPQGAPGNPPTGGGDSAPHPAKAAADDPRPRPIPDSADPDLLDDFVTEGYDHLDMAESALLTLESQPGDAEAVNVVFRAFHTIKGVAGFLELSEVADFAHHAESVLSRVRDGTLDFSHSVADLTLRSSDLLRGLLDGIRSAMGTDDDMAVPRGYGELLAILSDEDHVARLAAGAPLLLSVSPETGVEGTDGGEAGSAGPSGGSTADGDDSEGSVRVRTGRLDRLLDLVGELVVSHSMVAEDPALRGLTELQRKVVRSEKILRELQDLTTGMRMVPMKPAFRKVTRVVRDVSRRSGKSVRLVTSGEDTELDRTMVDILADPLVHMVRNAVDHGIESPEERAAAGKDPEGVIRLNAYQTGGNVVVEISDDGRGLDREKLLRKAVERGVVESDRGLSDEDVYQLIFAAGFSTAEEVTDISGRGVGMDVVRKSVESLRGRVEIDSTPGRGSRFAIHLPLTLAITDGMLMGVGGERYIIPIVKIHSSLRPTRDDLTTVQGRGELVKLHEELLPVVRLHRLYEVPDAKTDPTEGLLVILGEGTRRFALMVDEILGQQQFVVKAMTGQVSHAPGVAGGAILGDGRVGLILDPDDILNLSRRASGSSPGAAA